MVHYSSQLANSLSKYGDVSVIAGEGVDESLFESEVSLNLVDIPPFGFNSRFFNVRFVVKILKRIKPDVIHITANHIWIIALYPYLQKENVVFTLHDVESHAGANHLFTNNLLNKVNMNLSKRIFVHGENLKKILLTKGYSEMDISVIKHGDYSFLTNYMKNIDEDGSVLFFGRILDYKGLPYLIKSVPLIKAQIPDINVIIAGMGDFNKYKDLIEFPENFEIINMFIPDDRIPEFFQRAGVVVLPYIEGSQTGIIPIAYSFKKPVVATNVGSIPEVVEDGVTGYIVPPRDHEKLADAIIKILKNDSFRKQLGENAYAKMKRELSWDLIARETINVYESTVGSKR